MRDGGRHARFSILLFLTALCCLSVFVLAALGGETGGQTVFGQPPERAQEKSAGCISCHTPIDNATMHAPGTVVLGCTDCHGGREGVIRPPEIKEHTREYDD